MPVEKYPGELVDIGVVEQRWTGATSDEKGQENSV